MANDLVEVFYLEMFEPRVGVSLPPRDRLAVVHVENPTVPYYRALFDAVGAEFHWYSRKEMSDQALAAIIGDPRNELHVLHADGVAAGFAEIDRRRPEDVELAFFGLIRSFIGKGLGKWFLQWAVAKAWSSCPRRVWLHTCTDDHPAALPNYLKAGFTIFRKETLRRPNHTERQGEGARSF